MEKALFFLACFVIALISQITAQSYAYPDVSPATTVDHYWGEKIEDPYRSLEKLDSPTTQTWLTQQQALARTHGKQMPKHSRIYEFFRLLERAQQKVVKTCGEYSFELSAHNQYQTPTLQVRKQRRSYPHTQINPQRFREYPREQVQIVDFQPSTSGEYLAFSLSRSGSDWREIRLLNVKSGKQEKEVLRWVKFSPIAWKDKGFYYIRYYQPPEGEELLAVNQYPKLYYHRVGTPQEKDVLIFAPEVDAPFQFQVSSDGSFLLIYTPYLFRGNIYQAILHQDLRQNGESTFWPLMMLPKEREFAYRVLDFCNGYFLVRHFGPLQGTRVSIHKPYSTNKGEGLWEMPGKKLLELTRVGAELMALLSYEGNYEVRLMDVQGKPRYRMYFPEHFEVFRSEYLPEENSILFWAHSFYVPTRIFRLNLQTLDLSIEHSIDLPYDPSTYTTRIVNYPGKDGTAIPMYLTHRKGLQLDTSHPTMLYGYGGFGIETKPFYDPGTILLLQNDGILAVPLVRGGGFYGKAWHQAGARLNKQQSFDDFIAAAEYLISEGYTHATKLGITGTSNGGLLVGAAMTQRPELFAAAMPKVGVFDMLRYETFTVGHYLKAEYGSTDDYAEYQALKAYSPLHQVRAKQAYPATLVLAADHDDRVPPLHSFKFLAALQEQAPEAGPYVLYWNKETGHEGPQIESDRLKQLAYQYAFFFQQVGVVPEFSLH